MSFSSFGFRLSMGIIAALSFLAACKKENANPKPAPVDTTHIDTTHQDSTHHDSSQIVRITGAQYYAMLDTVYGAIKAGVTAGSSLPGYTPGLASSGDASNSDFVRAFWMLQELPSDEAIIAWNDVGLQDINTINYISGNPFCGYMFYRCYQQIRVANRYIRLASDSRLAASGISGDSVGMIRQFRQEARFLRAYQYWAVADLWGKGPFFTEQDSATSPLPGQADRRQLFTYVESELKDLENTLPEAFSGSNTRPSKAAARALLARLYLNAVAYIGEDHYADAAAYARKVIDGGYALCPNYRWLFQADNDQAPASNEIVMAVGMDGSQGEFYGSTTFLTHASIGGSMKASNYGVVNAWAGIRSKKNLFQVFGAGSNVGADTGRDRRAMFYTRNQNLEIAQATRFNDGYALVKWRNLTKALRPGSDPTGTFVDTDFPLFRLGEMYLIYAEAAVRGQAGLGQAVVYVNALRRRAAEGSSQNPSLMDVTAADLTLGFIQNERARELYWEGHRRTDLIRFGTWASGYNWPFKNGVQDGANVDPHFAVYPIPNGDIVANANLTQNPGY